MNVKQKALEIGLSEKEFTGLIETFIRQTGEDLEQMDKASRDNNWDKVGQLAHHIKGAAANLEIPAVFDAARSMERRAGSEDGEDAFKLLDLLKNSFTGFEKAVNTGASE